MACAGIASNGWLTSQCPRTRPDYRASHATLSDAYDCILLAPVEGEGHVESPAAFAVADGSVFVADPRARHGLTGSGTLNDPVTATTVDHRSRAGGAAVRDAHQRTSTDVTKPSQHDGVTAGTTRTQTGRSRFTEVTVGAAVTIGLIAAGCGTDEPAASSVPPPEGSAATTEPSTSSNVPTLMHNPPHQIAAKGEVVEVYASCECISAALLTVTWSRSGGSDTVSEQQIELSSDSDAFPAAIVSTNITPDVAAEQGSYHIDVDWTDGSSTRLPETGSYLMSIGAPAPSSTDVPGAENPDSPAVDLAEAVTTQLAAFQLTPTPSAAANHILLPPLEGEGYVEAPAAFAAAAGSVFVADLHQLRLLVTDRSSRRAIALPAEAAAGIDLVVSPDAQTAYVLTSTGVQTYRIDTDVAEPLGTSDVTTLVAPGEAQAYDDGLLISPKPGRRVLAVGPDGQPPADPAAHANDLAATIDTRQNPIAVSVFRGDALERTYTLDGLTVIDHPETVTAMSGSATPLTDDTELVTVFVRRDERLDLFLVVVRAGQPIELLVVSEIVAPPTSGRLVEIDDSGVHLVRMRSDTELVIETIEFETIAPSADGWTHR